MHCVLSIIEGVYGALEVFKRLEQVFSFVGCLGQERTLRTNVGSDDGGMLCEGSSQSFFFLSVYSENRLHKSYLEYVG